MDGFYEPPINRIKMKRGHNRHIWKFVEPEMAFKEFMIIYKHALNKWKCTKCGMITYAKKRPITKLLLGKVTCSEMVAMSVIKE